MWEVTPILQSLTRHPLSQKRDIVFHWTSSKGHDHAHMFGTLLYDMHAIAQALALCIINCEMDYLGYIYTHSHLLW